MNYFKGILKQVIQDKPSDYQLELFVNLYGKEYAVLRHYPNYIKLGTESWKLSFYSRLDI